jgi:nuclear pore complex protein Nup210
MVEALDSEGNTFSSLDGLAFEWSIINDIRRNAESQVAGDEKSSSLTGSIDSRNVLRTSKFIDSEYEISESIRQLESIGLSGHKILIEGLKTGTANVQSKLLDPYYKDALKTPPVRLLVVANIMLEPSYPVFVLLGAIIKYNVFLIKQTSIEKISLPSQQYFFESRNTTVANLLASDKSGSTMVGLELGSTEIVLVDRNMKEEFFTNSNGKIDPQLVVPPPTAQIHVVSPGYLVFTIKNWRSSWILEVGRTYEIAIQVYSTNRELVFPSDNLFIDSQFDVSKFHLDSQSRNGSYHVLTVIDKGFTKALASLKGTLVRNNDLNPFTVIATGEQDIELLDPIDVIFNLTT